MPTMKHRNTKHVLDKKTDKRLQKSIEKTSKTQETKTLS